MSFARIRFESVLRRIQNRPLLEAAQMCVNPRNANVSGFPSPRAARLRAACRPNSISRVLPGCSSSPNFANLPRSSCQEPLSVVTVLEPDDEVVSEPHDDHITARMPLPPPVGPQVQDVVQVHVREQRRNRCPLR